MNAAPEDVDEEALAELREDLADAFDEFARGFLGNARSELAQLSEELEQGAAAAAGARAHRLKGTAGYLGATALSRHLAGLQRAAQDGCEDEARDCARAAQQALEALSDHLDLP